MSRGTNEGVGKCQIGARLGPSLQKRRLGRKQREEIIISQWYKADGSMGPALPHSPLRSLAARLRYTGFELYYSFGFFNWSGCGVYREPDWMPPSPFSAAALPLHSAIFAFPFFHCVYFGLRVQNWYRATRQASGSSLFNRGCLKAKNIRGLALELSTY